MSERKTTTSQLEADLAVVEMANQERLKVLKAESDNLKNEMQELLQTLEGVFPSDGTVPDIASAQVPARKRLEEVGCGDNSGGSSWTKSVRDAKEYLQTKGHPVPTSLSSLLTAEEDAEISEYLNRPLYERIPWDKWDYLVAFGAGLAGAAIDVLLATPGKFGEKAVADKSNWMGQWAEDVHSRHADGAPIDYQGKHFGGSYHRGLSPGHDLFRPLEGIEQFRDGVFRGTYFADGISHPVETALNQHGVPYKSMGWGSAVLAWLVHLGCDFFSSRSLPIPGTSWLYEMPSREVRVLVQRDLYQNGINLRHLTFQALAPTVVEGGIGVYSALRYRNSDMPKDALLQKRLELLVLGHTLVTAVNVGKVVILEDPTMLNVPAILALLRRLFHVIVLEQRRNSFITKLARNVSDLERSQAEIERVVLSRLSSPVLLS